MDLETPGSGNKSPRSWLRRTLYKKLNRLLDTAKDAQNIVEDAGHKTECCRGHGAPIGTLDAADNAQDAVEDAGRCKGH